MPIVTLQQQMRELGRIRTGVTVPASGNKRARPGKLETFRLTSDEQGLIDAAAAMYGGVVSAWGEGQWEVITTSASLDILVPPWQALSQWFELWSAGGCQRRCDGQIEALTDHQCLCPVDPAERRALANANPPGACKPTTRLNVMLPALPGLGVWRLESHGYYAAVELAGAARILALATRAGNPLAARLRLDQRTKKVPNQPPNHYAVPVIEILEARLGDLLAAAPEADMLQIGSGRRDVLEAPETPLDATSDFRAPGAVDAAVVVDAPLAPLEPPGLSSDELKAWLRANQISASYADGVVRIKFPGRDPAAPWSNAERLLLRDAIARSLEGGQI